MRKLSLLITILALMLAVFALAGCGSDDDDEAASDDVTVELSEVDGSGQTGTATLTSDGEMTLVSIQIDGDPVSDSQPAHIHEGNCGDELNPEPLYGLPNVAGGSSEASVEASVDTLTGDDDYAINLHMSDDDLETYTSCGNID
ncbi:MAG: hypothetical protein M3546_17095 [Actinomycetota bacterium]|nr:hypothetical protein [Actinomycetota bacterium]